MAPPEPADPFSDLREGLRATQAAAARLAGGGEVPPQGWAAAGASGAERDARSGSASGVTEELQELVAVLASLREIVPPELQGQLTDLIRQVLLLVRAILDRWIERLEPAPGDGGPDVEDIPIG